MERMTEQDYIEIEEAMESVLDTAMEAVKGHVIDPKVRDALPDKAFAVVFTDENGKTQRKYPLVVKNDPEATKELVGKAISFFHFAKPEWKAQIAKKILQVIKEQKLTISINEKSQIFKYIKESDLPNTVTITRSKKED